MSYQDTSNGTSIILADSNRLLGEGLKLILNEVENNFSVLYQQDSLKDLKKILDQNQSVIVLAELFDGDTKRSHELKEFLSEFSGAEVIVYSVSTEKEDVLEAFRSGAVGYLSKRADITVVVEALTAVSKGYYYIDPCITHFLLQEFHLLSQNSHDTELFSVQMSSSIPLSLTKKEMEVTRLVSQGKSNKLIGKSLGISEKTVKNHISHILTRLELNDRTQLAVRAIKNGWVLL